MMLQVVRRGGGAAREMLSAEDDGRLRAAFGRFGKAAARPIAAPIVSRHQTVGCWFACDCLGNAAIQPVLVPVVGAFLRRHVEGPWPERAWWCDFFREPSSQASISRSYRPAKSGIQLVRAFAGQHEPSRPGVRLHGRGEGRGRLAQVLFKLLEGAEMTTVIGGVRPTISQQYRSLRDAAKAIEIDGTMPVSSILCTFRPALGEFIERIERMPGAAFRRSGNPHGIFIGIARSARHGVIEPVTGEPIPVAGEIAIFGERDGQGERPAHPGDRSPYVMACLVGRRDPQSPFEVLRAYLHPCLAAGWLFPVDSNLERQTMNQLLGLTRWFAERQAVTLTIRKPVHDMSPPETEDGEDAAEPPEPVVPDFIVETGQGRRIVVETMGFDDEAYRRRKARMHGAMSRVCGGAPVIAHDFFRPSGVKQRDRDDEFWLSCRAALLRRRSDET